MIKTKGYVIYSNKTLKTKANNQLFKSIEDATVFAKSNGFRNYGIRRIVTI